jgi:hypothetical protein
MAKRDAEERNLEQKARAQCKGQLENKGDDP